MLSLFVNAMLVALIYNAHAYKGKVFDYTPECMENDAELRMQKNFQELMNKINKDDNVVVFPEYGLTSFNVLSKEYLPKFGLEIPEVNPDNPYLGDSKHKILRDLARAAEEHRIYLLANIIEVSGNEYYNTNLVFDTMGKLIAKYRKINLNEEESVYLTPGNKIVSFKTEDGYFTTFTGSDILYVNPALTAVKDVTNVLYPSALNSKSPFWSSLSLQDGYAKRTGVNLLASSYNNYTCGHGGSGIYNGYIPKKIHIENPEGLTNALVSEVDITELERPACISNALSLIEDREFNDIGYLFNMHGDTTIQNSYDLPRGEKKFQAEICSNITENVCCKFNANIFNPIIDGDPHYKFIMISKGNHNACGLVSCENDSITSCGTPILASRNNKFTLIRVEMHHNSTHLYVIPSTLRNNMKPINNYEYCSDSNTVKVELRQQHSLLAFGIVFSDAAKINNMVLLISISLIIIHFITGIQTNCNFQK